MARKTIYRDDEKVCNFRNAKLDATDKQCIIYPNGEFLNAIRILLPLQSMELSGQKVTLVYPEGLIVVASHIG